MHVIFCLIRFYYFTDFDINMPWKQEMERELQTVKNSLKTYQLNIHKCMKNLESKRVDREKTRKEILLREMKTILAKLNQEEAKLIGDIKSEAFDVSHHIRGLEEEVEAEFEIGSFGFLETKLLFVTKLLY